MKLLKSCGFDLTVFILLPQLYYVTELNYAIQDQKKRPNDHNMLVCVIKYSSEYRGCVLPALRKAAVATGTGEILFLSGWEIKQLTGQCAGDCRCESLYGAV